MKVYIQIAIFAYLFLYINAFHRKVKIIGGIITDISEFPYVVSLRTYFENNIICGGAIISNKHILTAAHCVLSTKNDYTNVRVYTGSNSSSSTSGPMFKINKIYIHPKYKLGNIDDYNEYFHHYDIAVVQINGIMEFNKFQNKIDLPTSPASTGDNAIVIGWGQFEIDFDVASELLRKADMIILDNKECAMTHPFAIAEEQLCAYQGKGFGICTGDSGSPLVSNGKLVGLVSFGLPCATGISDIYTRIFSCMDFIRSIVFS